MTVVLNDVDGLGRTLESLQMELAGSPIALEWTVVDGGSLDGTRTLAEESPLIQLHDSRSDDGLYEAMNLGLDASSGKYVWFLNAGDIALSGFISAVQAAEAGNFDIVNCGLFWIARGPQSKSVRDRSRLYRAPRKRTRTGNIPAPHPATIVRRRIAESVRFREDLRISGDYAFLRGCHRLAVTELYFDEPISGFVLGGVSGSRVGLMAREADALDREDSYPFIQRLGRFLIRYVATRLLPIIVHLRGVSGESLPHRARILG